MPSPRASASFTASRKALTTSPRSDRVGDLLNEVGFGHSLLLGGCEAKSCRFVRVTYRATPVVTFAPAAPNPCPDGVGRSRRL